MRVLVFSGAYPNSEMLNHGIFVKERMTGLAALEECEVKVVAPVPYFPSVAGGWRSKYARIARRETFDGIEVYHPRYLVTPRVGMSFHGLSMFLGALQTVRKLRLHFDFDLISAHTVYPDGFAGALLGKHFRKPVVVSARGSDINVLPQYWTIRQLIRWTIDVADSVIGVSHALQTEMHKISGEPRDIHVVPNGIDTSKFFPIPTEAARSKLKLPDKPTVLSVGELRPLKGFHKLIEAFAVLAKHSADADIQLLIVGEGQYRQELEKLIAIHGLEERVILVGTVPHRELVHWYNAADLFCLASEREGWPNVIMEAMACGIPVVATRVGGIPEIIKNEDYGLLINPDPDPDAIAAVLEVALARTWNSGLIAAYAAGRGWINVAGEMLRLFEQTIENSK